MATTFELRISTPQERAAAAERALQDCHALIGRIEDELTEFRPASPVARLNCAAVGERIELPASTWDLIEESLRIEDLSAGAFSASAKSTEPGRTRDRFGLDRSAHTAWKLQPGSHLGFGAIGKGYALDRCRESIERAGFTDFLLSGGGSSLILSGYSGPEESPWTWAWSWSTDENGKPLGIPISHASGLPIAVGVSGIQEKGLHLIDPRSRGALRPEDLRSALVAHPSAARADALSTALFVGGWDDALARFGALLHPPAVAVIDGRGIPRWNGVFQDIWGPLAGS